jgi:hypothetical protein
MYHVTKGFSTYFCAYGQRLQIELATAYPPTTAAAGAGPLQSACVIPRSAFHTSANPSATISHALPAAQLLHVDALHQQTL